MDFLVLGALRVRRDDRDVDIDAAHKPRLTLAALLSRANRPASVDWLTAVLWGDRPPASARRNLQLYVYKLRSRLGCDRILRRPGGYVIACGDELDTVRFRTLAAQGTFALDRGDPVTARGRLRAALDLWRGAAFAEFRGYELIAEEAERLEQLRLITYEQWAEAELAIGRHVGLPIELSDLIRTHPYRENLRAQLMRALYAAGRQADALQVYRDTRALLNDHLGIEPGPALQRLHTQVLRGDLHVAPSCRHAGNGLAG